MSKQNIYIASHGVIIATIIIAIYYALNTNMAAVIGMSFLLCIQFFFRSVIKAYLDEDEGRSKQHGGT